MRSSKLAFAVAVALILPAAQAAHFGTLGQTYPIAEESALTMIMKKLQEKERTGELKKLQQEAVRRSMNSVKNMPPVDGITTVTELPAGYANFDQWLSGTQLERELKVQEYSVSNRGLRPNLVGTPEQLRERIEEYEDAGLDLLLLQMSPQEEEMERFAAQVMGTA